MFIDNVTLVFYVGNETITKPLNNASQIVSDSRFNTSYRCDVYIFGWRASPNDRLTLIIRTAYKKAGICLILLDWSELASQNYTTCVATLRELAMIVAKAFDGLAAVGVKFDRFVGHSLGAHSAGYICSYMIHTCVKIVGLDMAGPFFFFPRCYSPLNKTNAACVSILHTNAALFGTAEPTGTVDFYANGGYEQPGCLMDAIPTNSTNITQALEDDVGCSHGRAGEYWAEQVENTSSFQGKQCCTGFLPFQICTNRTILKLGECNSTSPTKYYFTTNYKSPYGKGPAGCANSMC